MNGTPGLPVNPFETPLDKGSYYAGENMAQNQNRRERIRSNFIADHPDFLVTQVGTKSGPWAIEGKVSDISETGLGLTIKPGRNKKKTPGFHGKLEEGNYIQIQFSVKVSKIRISLPVLGQVVWIRPGESSETRVGMRYIL